MRITYANLSRHQPISEDVVHIIGDEGEYTLTGKQIEELLIEDGQMCGDCHDTGEVTVDEAVYPDAGSPTAAIGTRKCHCQDHDPDET